MKQTTKPLPKFTRKNDIIRISSNSTFDWTIWIKEPKLFLAHDDIWCIKYSEKTCIYTGKSFLGFEPENGIQFPESKSGEIKTIIIKKKATKKDWQKMIFMHKTGIT